MPIHSRDNKSNSPIACRRFNSLIDGVKPSHAYREVAYSLQSKPYFTLWFSVKFERNAVFWSGIKLLLNCLFLFIQFLQSHSVIQECLHDFLNKESSRGASPHKKARLADLNKRWGRIRTILQSRERKLKALGVLISEVKTPPRKPVFESIVPEKEKPILASTPKEVKKPEVKDTRVTTPKSKSPSPSRELKTPPSLEKKSPRTKKKQYEEELREFSEWLTSQEKAFHDLVDDESLPPTMEALKERLKQFQVL